MAERSGQEMVRYRMKYPYSYNEKDRYIKYDVTNPAYVSFRRYRGEPQPGDDPCHPSIQRQRVRLDQYDVVYTKPQAQTRTDTDGNLQCRE